LNTLNTATILTDSTKDEKKAVTALRVAKFEEIWQFGMAINTGDTVMLTMDGQIQRTTEEFS